MKNVKCDVCGNLRTQYETYAGSTIRPSLYSIIAKQNPAWSAEQTICLQCLNEARSSFVESSLIQERGELSDIEKAVVASIRDQDIVAENPDDAKDNPPTWGEKLSDQFSAFGGSWTFILVFLAFMLIWFFVNADSITSTPFDPYPYILLNLLLSSLAALQAPVIMMSQNRKEQKDRRRAELDYKTNLKAELEIRHLHIKIDQLISQQWHRLIEIQQVQTDLLKDILDARKSNK